MRAYLLRLLAPIALFLSGCTQPHSADPSELEAMIVRYTAKTPDAPLVLSQQLLSEKDWLLVDVRPEKERAISTLPNAISLDQFEARKASLSGQQIAAYCTVGLRSGQWVESIRKEGFDAYNLRGGVLSWTHAAGPLVDPSGASTVRVHVYAQKWDLVAPGYEGVW